MFIRGLNRWGLGRWTIVGLVNSIYTSETKPFLRLEPPSIPMVLTGATGRGKWDAVAEFKFRFKCPV